MRLALLQADWVNPEYQRTHGDLPQMFAAFFSRRRDIELEVFRAFERCLPDQEHRADAYLMTGSRRSAYENEPWIADLRTFIAARHRRGDRLIGICFGHQLIAQALGGQVERAPKGWNLGVQDMILLRRRPWMRPARDGVRMIFNHRDQVVRLPPEAVVLAGDATCPVRMYEIGGSVLGIQGHPEYSTAYQEDLMKAASTRIAPLDRLAALAANRGPAADTAVLLDWIVNFVQHEPERAVARCV